MNRDFDYKLLIVAVVLGVIGVISVYSATHYTGAGRDFRQGEILRNQSNLWVKQIIWLLFAIMSAVIISNINYHRFWDLAWIFFVFNLLLLLLVLLIGSERSGAQRWLDLGPLSLQPSEIVKFSLIIVLARYFTKLVSYHFSQSRYHSQIFTFFRLVLLPFSLILMPMFLVMIQPDLGSSLVLLPIFIAIIFCAQVPKRFIFFFLSCGFAAVPFLWGFLKDYQKQRLLVFLDPQSDPMGAGYTIAQSKIAIGSGQFFGKGWLSGTQNQLNFLPERHTDFIFSVVAEEWGFFGSTLIIMLYLFLLTRIVKIASTTSDVFGRLICIGIAALLSFQVFVNIAMTSGIMPVVGLPLPFISYGGSSLMLSFIALGLVLNVSRHSIS